MKLVAMLMFSAVALAAMLFAGCSGDSPVSAFENHVESVAVYAANRSSSSRSSSSSYYYRSSSSYYRSSSSRYSSSSSYYSAPQSYLTRSKTMVLTLTKLTTNFGNLVDVPDPAVWFEVYSLDQYGDTLRKESTDFLIRLENQTKFDSTASTTLYIPAKTYKIQVCPKVIDIDSSLDGLYVFNIPSANFNGHGTPHSSGKCYTDNGVGYLSDYQKVAGSETYDGTREWYWYLY